MDGRFCQVCNVDHEEDQSIHNNSYLHRFNFLLFQWNTYKKPLVQNRHGVEVSIQLKEVNGFVYDYTFERNKGKYTLKIQSKNLLLHGNELNFSCTVENKRKSNIILTAAKLLHPIKLWLLIDPQNNLDQPHAKYVELEPGTSYKVLVKFKIDNPVIGSYKIPVCFNFQTVGDNADTFTIARAIVVSIEDFTLQEEELGKSPFTSLDWVGDIKLTMPTKNLNHMCMYPIPSDIYPFLKSGLRVMRNMGSSMFQLLNSLLMQMQPGHVTLGNYQKFWHIVLWLEEVAQVLMLRRYNMENVFMTLNGDSLQLEVPGLAEKRPSVIAGDMIDIRLHGDHKAYRGVIRKVEDKVVQIQYVNEEFIGYIRNNPEIELDVRFVLNRLPLERMHQGVDQTLANGLVPALFPSSSLGRRVPSMSKTLQDSDFFNQNIYKNAEQRTAVLNILNGTSAHVPYLVFGPPGTGKTVTIVEAILQLMKNTTKKILVCAPANAACDMLTEKLMKHCKKKELIRIMSENVDRQNLHPLILEYSNYVDGVFLKPTAEELSEYRIVVTTLILIGRYSRRYHPDVIFIDEAAQPCEPEACCAFGMIEKGRQIVLAGDPKQLGPSTSSRVSNDYGLGVSLLERLMALDLYKSSNPYFITMLKLNFRSHKTVLSLPNELFYDNQLLAVSTKAQNDPVSKVFVYQKIKGFNNKKKNKIQSPGQAVEFCSIISQEARQGRSPSYFNTKEMQMVLKYVEALTDLRFDAKEDTVTTGQIGVVTPYIRQVYKIRETLRSHGFEGVEVGTTETFQGREKRIIIISTVRAQQDLLAYDKKYNLGFVKNEKRFNVALTRAMSKLIVIGCAHVLGTDDKWLSYISLCEELNAFCGSPYVRRTEEVMEDISNRVRNVQFLDTQHNH